MPDAAELDALRSATGRPYALALGSDAEPAAVITAYADADHPAVLWGSWFGGEVIIGVDPLVTDGGLDAADCRSALAVMPALDRPTDGIGGGWVTCLGYDPGTSWLGFYDALLRRRPDGRWFFETLGLVGREDAVRAALAQARTALSAPTPTGATTELGPLAPVGPGEAAASDHIAGVERVIGRIRAGEVYQLNLCTRLTAPLTGSALRLFAAAADRLRPAYGAYLSTGPTTSLVSLSPERFLTVHGEQVVTSPIKGTTNRSEDPDGTLLRASRKDAAENIMITDLMRNDLSRVCEPGSVAVSRLLDVQPHPGVWHLVSTVTGRLRPGTGVPELLAATFPPGSVTGAPKSSAVRAIAAEEVHPRGAYTGAAGLVSPSAGVDLSVLIRTFEVTGDRVELGVGGGITVDSVPVREWQECLHKAGPLAAAAGSRLAAGVDIVTSVAAGSRPAAGRDTESTGRGSPRRSFRRPTGPVRVPDLLFGDPIAAHGVFESILVRHGQPLRLADHVARVDRSVRELYAVGLPDDLASRLLAAAATAAGSRAAIRVTARPTDRGIETRLAVRPLGPRLTHSALRRADRTNRSWRHKWSDRAELDAAEATAAPALPYFVGPDGRLAETSRGNLFVQAADGIWRTPPADDALLPGVTRRALLDVLADRRVPILIAPVAAADLERARAVVWSSSLSGVVAVDELDGRPQAGGGPAATWSGWLGFS